MTYPQASCDATHDNGNKMVEVTVSWSREFERAEADLVKSLIVNTEGLIRVLDKLVNGESGIVWLKRSFENG